MGENLQKHFIAPLSGGQVFRFFHRPIKENISVCNWTIGCGSDGVRMPVS